MGRVTDVKHRLTYLERNVFQLVLSASRSRNEINGRKIDVVLSLLISRNQGIPGRRLRSTLNQMEHPRKVFSGMERWPKPITHRPRFPSSWTGVWRRVADLRFRLLGPKLLSFPSFRSSIRNSFGSNFVDDDRTERWKKRRRRKRKKKKRERDERGKEEKIK